MEQDHTRTAWAMTGSPCPVPNEPSRWEQFLSDEHIDEQDALKHNPKIREFVVKNYRSFFVPTKVLKVYGMELKDA